MNAVRLISVILLAVCRMPSYALPPAVAPDTVGIGGLWRFQLDPMGFGKAPGSELYLSRLSETIVLPGTTDTGGKGVKNTAAHVDRLSRKYEYSGPAWYQREVTVPADWSGKEVELELERSHWLTTVYVDGKEVASGERLSTPGRWMLTGALTPGTHTLTVCVDNRAPFPMDQWNHGTTEHTQTNWNGMVGRMNLMARPATRIESLKLYPDAATRSVGVSTRAKVAEEGLLTLVVESAEGEEVAEKMLSVAPGDSIMSADIALGRDARLWDEFDPALYTVTATLSTESGIDSRKSRFGLRSVRQGRHHIKINGIDRHLRGSLECAVWPLTGYPPTDKADWLRIMNTVCDYGMNHMRFHSWCPPEAAFEAADELGLYLQVELPMWIKDVGQYPERRLWFEREMYAILDEYGNHPSFVLFCCGNENEGDFAVLEDLVVKGKAHDPRHLYSASTARTHTASDEFYVSHVTDKGRITVYEGHPSTDWDVNGPSEMDVPVIAHESGQRCMYPDFSEMGKYTGVLEPRNMGLFRDRLARNGMLHQAGDFLKATGAHTVLQYKEVNEALLRSDRSGGFQLLGLQDFPGQGSAYVGILDAFWESKNLVSPEKYRESCAPEVLLVRMPKRVYSSSEPFRASVHLYNFGPADIRKGSISWYIEDHKGNRIAAGRISHGGVARSSVDSLGRITADLSAVEVPGRYTLHARENELHNSWDIWIYPDRDEVDDSTYVTDPDEAIARLEKGENVLLIPSDAPGRKTRFASHFWNPIMFNWDPMIVGTLISGEHPAFGSFPTEMHADWQWTDILNNARAMDLTEIESLTPVIQSIDTYEVNRKLGIAFEARVGEGRLFVLCVDPEKNIGNRPATRRLLHSIADYVAGDTFKPGVTLEPHQVKVLFTPSAKADGGSASEAIRQLLNE